MPRKKSTLQSLLKTEIPSKLHKNIKKGIISTDITCYCRSINLILTRRGYKY